MRTFCKHTHIANQAMMRQAIDHFLKGKRGRRDVMRWLDEHPDLDLTALDMAIALQEHRTGFPPIHYFERIEPITGKHRVIGRESIDQQIYDHAAVLALKPLTEARIGRWQTSTIPGRGILDSRNAIKRWVNDGRSRYFVKLDIVHYYPTIPRDRLKTMLARDVGDRTLLWLIGRLIDTNQGGTGLNIGSYLSQTLANYYLSGAYRRVLSLSKTRRGKRRRLVTHALFYMDDMLLMGRDARDLTMAARSLERHLRDKLGLRVHPDWHVQRIGRTPVDMVGYRFLPDRTTLRPALFLRARRAFARASRPDGMCRSRAKRCASYWGWLYNSDSIHFRKTHRIDHTMRRARRYLSKEHQ